ncbi:MAG: DUF255 domain-containing protein [Pseudomonadota bacterium]
MTRHAWILLLLFALTTPATQAKESDKINWRDNLDASLFSEARDSNRFVLLNLEAVWCHWCHVMDDKTYSNDKVADTLSKKYIAVRIDHDARPDLAQRYRRYGWPATIIFDGSGQEIVKRAGFISPENFQRLLNAVVDDPSPEAAARLVQVEQFNESPLLADEIRQTLLNKRNRNYDASNGGLKSNQKFLDADSVEYNLTLAMEDEEANQRVQQTLDAAIRLIDPVWGGAYQYSTFGDWEHPHFEKIMVTQARYIRIYSLAYATLGNPNYLDAANAIRSYMKRFMTDSAGAFYTSQDADLIQGKKGHSFFALNDADRMAQGVPRIDKNIYAQENGRMIEALATLYELSGDESALNEALAAANWIIKHRSLDGGGFAHGENDQAGPYLGDSLSMGRAALQLYRATADRYWLNKATSAAVFIGEHFTQEKAGFVSAVANNGPIQPVPHLDENISATRFFNLLAQYSGDQRFKKLAAHGMKYIATPDIATRRIDESGILLADRETANDPAHYTIIGAKSNVAAKAMYAEARSQPGWYKRIEWWDTTEGPLPNPDVKYPVLDKASGFVCTNGRCSLPAFDQVKYRELITLLEDG